MRRAAVLGVAILLAAAPLALPTAALAATTGDDPSGVTVTIPEADDTAPGGVDGEGRIDDAEFRWGINAESGSGAFAGGCNFLSAGVAGDAGGAREWREADGLYASRAGSTTIVKATASGSWVEAEWATKCLDRSGAPVSVTSPTAHTESQVVIEGGEGEVGPDGADIRWDGDFTVALYGGMTYWSASDPRLVLDADGNGRVTAELSGFATSRDDMSRWTPLAGGELVLAEIRGAEVTGITLSEEQLAVACRRAAEAGVADKVRFELIDYRHVTGTFDRIVSVGMFEHVGTPQYRTFFAKCRQLLKPDGVMLLHTIGRAGGPGVTDHFTAKYIFPGGYIPALSEIAQGYEGLRMFATDVEVLRLHYAYTLKAWYDRTVAAKAQIASIGP